tara:strand:- start:135 stop:704 length:570 start_codon:yes stop_codon:yes gene_type:complete
VWKPVLGFEGSYEVSCKGRVRSCARVHYGTRGRVTHHPSKILKQQKHKTNSWRIRFCVDQVKTSHSAHRLVSIAFHPNPENKPEVNHIDGNRLNNDMYNLEWNTKDENMEHAVRTGLINNPFGKGATNSKYRTYVWDLQGNLVATTYGKRDLESLGFDNRNVHATFTGKQKTHRGHVFTREEINNDRIK